MNKFVFVLLAVISIYFGESAIWSYPDIDDNSINFLRRIANHHIPEYLVGPQNINKQDIPGEELSPADFNAAELIFDSDFPIESHADPITNGSHFQGDIILPKMADLQLLEMNQATNGQQRSAIIDNTKKWTDGLIPYTISSSYGLKERAIIARAIAEYHTYTCIRFVSRSHELDYVHFTEGSGCSSPVGKTGGRQVISIGLGCVHKGIVMHEMMHTCGFWHEQSRTDRDDHVNIIWSNIRTGMEYNFQKYKWSVIQHLGVGYDTGSLMHYGNNAFAKDRRKDTITQKNLSGPKIGQREGFSEKDILKINTLYECVGNKPPTVSPSPVPVPPGSGCKDSSENCIYWETIGECSKNPWMKTNCAKSCGLCDVCEDNNLSCAKWKTSGYCKTQASYMQRHCKNICGFCHAPAGTANECKDDHSDCTYWSDNGECRVNESYMLKHCKKACGVC